MTEYEKMHKEIYPAYHMNKAYWVTAALDGSADDETVKMLTRMSFKLTETKNKSRKNRTYGGKNENYSYPWTEPQGFYI